MSFESVRGGGRAGLVYRISGAAELNAWRGDANLTVHGRTALWLELEDELFIAELAAAAPGGAS